MVKLDKLSVKELIALKDEITAELPKRKNAEIAALRSKVADLAKKHGIEPRDLLHGPNGKSRRKLTRYRDQKTGVEYRGAGRHPRDFDMRRAVPIR